MFLLWCFLVKECILLFELLTWIEKEENWQRLIWRHWFLSHLLLILEGTCISYFVERVTTWVVTLCPIGTRSCPLSYFVSSSYNIVCELCLFHNLIGLPLSAIVKPLIFMSVCALYLMPIEFLVNLEQQWVIGISFLVWLLAKWFPFPGWSIFLSTAWKLKFVIP